MREPIKQAFSGTCARACTRLARVGDVARRNVSTFVVKSTQKTVSYRVGGDRIMITFRAMYFLSKFFCLNRHKWYSYISDLNLTSVFGSRILGELQYSDSSISGCCSKYLSLFVQLMFIFSLCISWTGAWRI